jgi:putative nucleotidyltransferase with HDIG domain
LEAATKLSTARAGRPAPRPAGEGQGRRLTAAFEALDRFPALVEPRDRLLQLIREDHPPAGGIVSAVESDVALSVAVLRWANGARNGSGPVTSVPAAVEVLGSAGIEAIGNRAPVFDFFERTPAWDREPERCRVHALATQRATEHIARQLGIRELDELLVGALLHDVGKLVLVKAYAGYPDDVHRGARTPEERLHRERRELGVDHALVGGVLMRRWGLPARLATIVERHHADDADGPAAIVRLGDMLAHHSQGRSVESSRLVDAARAVSLSPEVLRRIMYELPNAPAARRATEPSPLSDRETEIIRGLAEGKVYKAIASDLGLSTSTVRTHLHNTYGKLGAVDRAQAVLIATERGWL